MRPWSEEDALSVLAGVCHVAEQAASQLGALAGLARPLLSLDRRSFLLGHRLATGSRSHQVPLAVNTSAVPACLPA
jgi:hypothetical protein